MAITLYGALRSDSTLSDMGAATNATGTTFQISAYNQITFDDGADGAVIAGDNSSNETGNDLTQTMAGAPIYWDYTIEVTDGTATYEIGLLDYDTSGNGHSIGIDSEDGYFMAFLNGAIPPLNTTLTINGIVDNGASIPVSSTIPCFTAGTRIATPQGPRAIEDLSVGDHVATADCGQQPIRWIGSRTVGHAALLANPKLYPVAFAPGSLGGGLPERALRVSPQHRMVLRSKIAMRMFGSAEVLIPAHKLIGLPGVCVDDQVTAVTYSHMLFDRHQIVFAEGAPTESLFTGPEALKAVGPEALAEITTLFPEIVGCGHAPVLARPVPQKGKLMKRLVARHLKNDLPLVHW